MKSLINTYQMTVGNREFLLVDVARGQGAIGTTTFPGKTGNPYERPPQTELLYCNGEAIINLTKPAGGDEYTDKMVNQINTLSACDDDIKTVLATVSDNHFTYSQSMSRSLNAFFDLLTDGLYVCHESKMLPGDGSGRFFWTAYTIKHQVTGTADVNRTMGKESNYIPCFLIPTLSPAEFSEPKVKAQREKMRAGKKIGGLAYHLSGMYSALLDGHHSATACLLGDADFRCVVVEPINNVLYGDVEHAAQHDREPKITALSCPYVKIPVEEIPSAVLESFLLRRTGVRPKYFPELVKKAGKTIRTSNRRSIPKEVLIKAELLPDCAVIESAYAVTELTDEQLDALLAGETKLGDETIISHNYYNSVVTACNYLQYEDFERFFNFASSIITNPDLTATHKYVMERLCSISDEKIYNLFVTLNDNADSMHSNFSEAIGMYIKNYEKQINDSIVEKNLKAQKQNKVINMLGSEMSKEGIAQMDAIIKASRGRG